MKKKYLLFGILMILGTPAHGMMYTWSDSSGIKHYVNSQYDIPLRYRARAKPLYPEASDVLAPQLNMQTLDIRPASETPPQHTKTEEPHTVTTSAPPPKHRHVTKLGINLKKSVGHRKNPKDQPEKK
jgi:hypothetical protein